MRQHPAIRDFSAWKHAIGSPFLDFS